MDEAPDTETYVSKYEDPIISGGAQYHFCFEDAKKYGVEEAVFLWNVRYCISMNRSNPETYHDGVPWFYNTYEQFTRYMSFFTKRQLERIIKNLIKKEAIVKSHFDGTDRKTYYTLHKSLLSPISPNGEMEFTEPCRVEHQTGKCTTIYKQDKKIEESPSLGPQKLMELWNERAAGDIVRPVRSLNTKRKTTIRNAMKEYPDWSTWEDAIAKIQLSSFLMGQGPKGWVISFDWFINPSNMLKVLEGNYDDKKPPQRKTRSDEIDDFFNHALNKLEANSG